MASQICFWPPDRTRPPHLLNNLLAQNFATTTLIRSRSRGIRYRCRISAALDRAPLLPKPPGLVRVIVVAAAAASLTVATVMFTEVDSIARRVSGFSLTMENSTVETSVFCLNSIRPHILTIDTTDGGCPWAKLLRAHGYCSQHITISHPISAQVRSLLTAADIVLLDLTTSTEDMLYTISELQAAIGICNLRPRILSFSSVCRRPQFVLNAQQCGARYVRITAPEVLFEAIDLLLAEMDELERKGPRFEIIHTFSRFGWCAPGEEISAVLLSHGGSFFQLPLGLAQRFVFDFLAQRRIAVDSLQVVSGLAGNWFYREHASNTGQRQLKKIRRPTVKVIIQRIREAMASTFADAQLEFRPYDVLRSCYADGSKRVLYKLHADVRWRHVPLR